MTPPTTPKRSESPIYEWPPSPEVVHLYKNFRLRDPLPLKKPLIERVREALERCGIVNEHAVQAVLEIIESNK